MFDVLVVGAGVVGSFAAWKLSRKGYSVLVFEEHPNIGQPVKCTGIIGQDCLNDFPFLRQLVLKSFSEAVFYSPSGLRIKVSKPSPKAFLINRALLDLHLAGLAQDCGARFIFPAKVRRVFTDKNRAHLIASFDGREVCFSGRVLLICSGFNPPLLKQLGIEVEGGVIGAQAYVDVEEFEGVEVYIGSEIAPGFFAWLVPYLNGKGVAGLISHRPRPYLERFLNRLKIEGKIGHFEKPLYKYLPLKPISKTYGDGFLIVGEAAGQIKPLTFGGIYYGLLCAQIACEFAHKALSQGSISSHSLSCYQKSWQRLLGKEIAISSWARKIYQHLSDSQIDFLFKLASSSGLIDKLVFPDFSFDWHSGLVLRAIRSIPWLKRASGSY